MKQVLFLNDLIQGTDAWLEFRKGKVGGSDLPSILKLPDAYKTRGELLKEKLSGSSSPVSDFTAELFRKGHEFEKNAVAAYSERNGKPYNPTVVQRTDKELHIASLDGYNAELCEILEIKSTRKAKHLEDAKANKVPEIYEVQIQWQMYCAGCERATLIVVDSTSGIMYPLALERNQPMIDALVCAADEFLNELSTGLSPFMQLETVEMKAIAAIKLNVNMYQAQIDEMNEKIKIEAQRILKEYGATRIEGFGITIQEVERAGNVIYKNIPELKNVDLEKYRGKPTKYVKITTKKENES